MRVHHSLYFVNLLSSIDHICDHLHDQPAHRAFLDQIEDGFGRTDNFKYVRELRNEIVHRGLDPTVAGHADDTTVYVLCPPKVQDRQRKESYTCSFKYIVQLAAHCTAVVDPAISATLNRLDLFNPTRHMVCEEDVRAAVRNSTAMPDWAKAMSERSFDEIDYSELAMKLAAARIKRMRGLLGGPRKAIPSTD
jgi:hypothetical protein